MIVKVLARDVDVAVVLKAKVIVPIKINCGSTVIVNNRKYFIIAPVAFVLVVKLYVIYGIDRLPYLIFPFLLLPNT